MKILLFMLGFVLAVSCFAKDIIIKGTTFSFEVDEKKVSASVSGDNYTFRFKDGKTFVLSPAPEIKPEMMDDVIKQAAKEVKEDIKQKKIANMKVKSCSVHDIPIGVFRMKEAAITTVRTVPNSNVEYVSCTYLILLWDGKTCLKGTYSCAIKSEIGIVHNILRTGQWLKEPPQNPARVKKENKL